MAASLTEVPHLELKRLALVETERGRAIICLQQPLVSGESVSRGLMIEAGSVQ